MSSTRGAVTRIRLGRRRRIAVDAGGADHPRCSGRRLRADAEIYNGGIEERTSTFETRHRDAADIAAWLNDLRRFPVLVAVMDGGVVGWARVARYSEREAYRGVGECQVYVDHLARGRGVGSRLLTDLCREAGMSGYWKLVGRLFTSNEASRALVRRCGFREVGVHRRHARLDGQWRDVLVVEGALEGPDEHEGDSLERDVTGDSSLPLPGGCGCGAVRFEVTAPLVAANYCHCTRCQRRSGTAASANARPEAGSFRLLSGEEKLCAWRPEDGWEKWFCGECGSAVFSRDPEDPERMSIRLGAFDTDPGIRPTVRQFVAYAAAWEAIPDDGLPRHPESAHVD